MPTVWPLWPTISSESCMSMNQQKRNEIIGRWQTGASIRQIARELGLARNAVSKILVQVQARREGDAQEALATPPPPTGSL